MLRERVCSMQSRRRTCCVFNFELARALKAPTGAQVGASKPTEATSS